MPRPHVFSLLLSRVSLEEQSCPGTVASSSHPALGTWGAQWHEEGPRRLVWERPRQTLSGLSTSLAHAQLCCLHPPVLSGLLPGQAPAARAEILTVGRPPSSESPPSCLDEEGAGALVCRAQPLLEEDVGFTGVGAWPETWPLGQRWSPAVCSRPWRPERPKVSAWWSWGFVWASFAGLLCLEPLLLLE